MPVRMEMQVDCLNNCCLTRLGFTPPRGGTRSIHDGGLGGGEIADIFFWVENLHARYFFGSRDPSHIFLGLISERNFSFRVFRCDQWIRKIFIQIFFFA